MQYEDSIIDAESESSDQNSVEVSQLEGNVVLDVSSWFEEDLEMNAQAQRRAGLIVQTILNLMEKDRPIAVTANQEKDLIEKALKEKLSLEENSAKFIVIPKENLVLTNQDPTNNSDRKIKVQDISNFLNGAGAREGFEIHIVTDLASRWDFSSGKELGVYMYELIAASFAKPIYYLQEKSKEIFRSLLIKTNA